MADEVLISAYVDDENERASAHELLNDPVDYEGMVEGRASEAAIEQLVARKISCARAEPAPLPERDPLGRRSKRTDADLRERLQEMAAKAKLSARAEARRARAADDEDSDGFDAEPASFEFEAAAESDDAEPEVEMDAEPQGARAYRVQLSGAMRREWREQLDQMGIDVTGYRRGMYQVYAEPEKIEALQAHSWVRDVKPYDLVDTVTTGLLIKLEEKEQESGAAPAAFQGDEDAEPDAENDEMFDAFVHREQDLESVVSLLESRDVKILERTRDAVRFRAGISSPLLATIAAMPEVRTVVHCERPQLYADRAAHIVGLKRIEQASAKRFDGRGEIVAVLDSGLCPTHPDFEGQVQQKIGFRGCPVDDTLGHGTHVAGIIAGNGNASNGAIRGLAPGAKLVIVGMCDDTFTPVIPLDIGELLQIAVDAGAKVINASWGRRLGSSYDAGSASVDKFLRANPDVLVVVAAGNEGTARPDGTYEFQSIGAPATAKNVLTVGASCTDRPEINKTWGQVRPAKFPKPAAADDVVSGDPDAIAAISSRGPTEFNSVKPDVLAPGTYIVAPRSRKFRQSLQWLAWKNDDYVHISGTSMATPVISAAAAVLRQYLREERNTPKPSAALLKAILISSTRRVRSRQDAIGQSIGYPDFDQGFGRVDLSEIIPDVTNPAPRRLVFVDIANDSPLALESHAPKGGDRKSTRVHVLTVADGPPAPLVITLTWTDAPGNDVQNNLHLEVRAPDDSLTPGNPQHQFLRNPLNMAGIQYDRYNTVEQVRIDAAAPGDYFVRVRAHNTVSPPQGYAVAAVGNIKGELAS